MYRSVRSLVLILLFGGCASHPTVSPVPLKSGETYLGYTLSAENVLPMIFYRRGLNEKWDVGLRVGMPIYGTGIDVSRILAQRDDRTDVLNLAYSLNPNHNIDYTYYRVRRKRKTDEESGATTQKLSYFGLRGMLISNGITGRRSQRFGLLIGGAPALKAETAGGLARFYRFQWEIGYYHDFSSMPLTALFDPTPFNATHKDWDPRFAEFPHTDKGLPTEHSRLTGISLRISFPLGNSRPAAPAEAPLEAPVGADEESEP